MPRAAVAFCAQRLSRGTAPPTGQLPGRELRVFQRRLHTAFSAALPWPSDPSPLAPEVSLY